MRIVFCAFLWALPIFVWSQFSPDGGKVGSIAIHADSVEWKGFASSISMELGWLDVADTTLGRIDYIARDAAIGSPDFDVQPLGDGGRITASFVEPFSDQQGFDFVVFENGFATSDTTGFFELAFVEVSSDGSNFFRFSNTSLSTAEDYAGPFAELDSRLIDGLAGRFSAPYGTPFDLADLPADPRLDIEAIRFVRIIDVVGSDDPAFAKTDSEGMPIIDPYPTAYNTGGFDLDAIGILKERGLSSTRAQPAFAKTSSAILAHKNELIEDLSTHTRWTDSMGRNCHIGPYAPMNGGLYITWEKGEKFLHRRVFVH